MRNQVLFGTAETTKSSTLTRCDVFFKPFNSVAESVFLYAERIETTVTAVPRELAVIWTVKRMQLQVHGTVAHATHGHFIDAALATETRCPIARLVNATISMNAPLMHKGTGKQIHINVRLLESFNTLADHA